MNEYLDELVSKYRNRGVLIDSNLLMLYFVGEFAPEQIPKLRRTKKFSLGDYRIIKAFFDLFSIRVTTPNILTEVSNLAGDIPGSLRGSFFSCLQTSFELLDEHHITSRSAAASPIFTRFGLTDAAITHLVPQKYLVLTDDFPLANYLGSIETDVINFNHLRSFSV